MVEGARLESVYTCKRIEGSNPFLSANNNPRTNRLVWCGVFYSANAQNNAGLLLLPGLPFIVGRG